MPVVEHQAFLFGGYTDHGKRTPFAGAELAKAVEPCGRHREHVAFLGFIAPDFERAQARFVAGHVAQLKPPAPPAVVDQFRQGRWRCRRRRHRG
jgi:hypothetical protein